MRFAWILLPYILLLTACPPRTFSGKDAEMMAAAKVVASAVDAYNRAHAEYPETLNEAMPYLEPGLEWPTDPYNHQPISDTGSPEFDAGTSVGKVYYQRMIRDEQWVNYQLHVFGAKGKLYIMGNSAMGLKE